MRVSPNINRAQVHVVLFTCPPITQERANVAEDFFVIAAVFEVRGVDLVAGMDRLHPFTEWFEIVPA